MYNCKKNPVSGHIFYTVLHYKLETGLSSFGLKCKNHNGMANRKYFRVYNKYIFVIGSSSNLLYKRSFL